MKIDGDRLLAWLDDQEAGLRAARMDLEDGSAAAHRVDGGLTILGRVRANLGSMSAQTPINKISKPVQTKLRRNDPSTSFSAALSQTPEKSRGLYMAIRGVLERKPMTDEELLELFESKNKAVTPSGVRSRRAELVEAGWVRDSGQKRETKTGHRSIVWEAVTHA